MRFYPKIVLTNLFIITSLLAYGSNSQINFHQSKTELRDESDYAEQIQEIEILKRSMIEYLKSAHPSYTVKDIEKCESILIEFIQKIDKTNSKEEGLAVVKTAVKKLNELNEKNDFQLIETDEREKIAKIIISMGNKKGYNALDEDITEKWREW